MHVYPAYHFLIGKLVVVPYALPHRAGTWSSFLALAVAIYNRFHPPLDTLKPNVRLLSNRFRRTFNLQTNARAAGEGNNAQDKSAADQHATQPLRTLLHQGGEASPLSGRTCIGKGRGMLGASAIRSFCDASQPVACLLAAICCRLFFMKIER